MSGSSDVGTVVIPMISVSALGGTKIEAPALEARNLGAPGLLGIDTLQGHAVTIDFERQQNGDLRPRSLIGCRHEVNGAGRDRGPCQEFARPARRHHPMPITRASVQVILDTGSVVSMGNLALREGRARRPKMLQPISLIGVTGTPIQADYTQVAQIKVAGLDFNNLPVAFADAPPFEHFALTKLTRRAAARDGRAQDVQAGPDRLSRIARCG